MWAAARQDPHPPLASSAPRTAYAEASARRWLREEKIRRGAQRRLLQTPRASLRREVAISRRDAAAGGTRSLLSEPAAAHRACNLFRKTAPDGPRERPRDRTRLSPHRLLCPAIFAAGPRRSAAARSAASSRHPRASVCPEFANSRRERRAGGTATSRREPPAAHRSSNNFPGTRRAAPCGRRRDRTRACPARRLSPANRWLREPCPTPRCRIPSASCSGSSAGPSGCSPPSSCPPWRTRASSPTRGARRRRGIPRP